MASDPRANLSKSGIRCRIHYDDWRDCPIPYFTLSLEGDGVGWPALVTFAKAVIEADRQWELVKPLPPGTCPDCRGTGDANLNRHERQWDRCETCGGSGEVEIG